MHCSILFNIANYLSVSHTSLDQPLQAVNIWRCPFSTIYCTTGYCQMHRRTHGHRREQTWNCHTVGWSQLRPAHSCHDMTSQSTAIHRRSLQKLQHQNHRHYLVYFSVLRLVHIIIFSTHLTTLRPIKNDTPKHFVLISTNLHWIQCNWTSLDVLFTNRKSHPGFRLVSESVTLKGVITSAVCYLCGSWASCNDLSFHFTVSIVTQRSRQNIYISVILVNAPSWLVLTHSTSLTYSYRQSTHVSVCKIIYTQSLSRTNVSTTRNEAGGMFGTPGLVTANNLSRRRGTTHANVLDD